MEKQSNILEFDLYQHKKCTWTPTIDKKYDPHQHISSYYKIILDYLEKKSTII